MDLSEYIQRRDERNAAILEAWQSDRRACRKAARLTYTCAGDGCLLLLAWQTPQGVAFVHPAYKLAPGRNEAASSASGRSANTFDGTRHWKAFAGILDDFAGWEGVSLNLVCDHVNVNVPTNTLLSESAAATPRRPTRRTVDAHGHIRPHS